MLDLTPARKVPTVESVNYRWCFNFNSPSCRGKFLRSPGLQFRQRLTRASDAQYPKAQFRQRDNRRQRSPRLDVGLKRGLITEKVHTSLAANNAARCTFATRINIYLARERERARAHTHALELTHTRTGNGCSARTHTPAHTSTRVYDTGTSEWLTSGNRRDEEISAASLVPWRRRRRDSQGRNFARDTLRGSCQVSTEIRHHKGLRSSRGRRRRSCRNSPGRATKGRSLNDHVVAHEDMSDDAKRLDARASNHAGATARPCDVAL